MYIGLVISAILHTALLAWALVTIRSQPELKAPEIIPVAVDMVTVSELNRMMQGVENGKPEAAPVKEAPKVEPPRKEPPKPKREPAAAPPPPEPEPPPPPPPEEAKKPEPQPDPIATKIAALPPPPPEPAPGPTPEERLKLEQQIQADEQRRADEKRKAEEQKKAEEKRKADERKKAEDKKKADEKRLAELKKRQEEEKKKKQFDADKISALLNKVPDKSAPPAAAPKADNSLPAPKGPPLGNPQGRDTTMSASELAVLAQIIRSCVQSKWTVLGGGETAQNAVVKMRLRFNQDGTLAAAPQVMNPQSTAYFLAVSDSAIRAVQACEPFNLPSPSYESWKDIVLNFNPRDMF